MRAILVGLVGSVIMTTLAIAGPSAAPAGGASAPFASAGIAGPGLGTRSAVGAGQGAFTGRNGRAGRGDRRPGSGDAGLGRRGRNGVGFPGGFGYGVGAFGVVSAGEFSGVAGSLDGPPAYLPSPVPVQPVAIGIRETPVLPSAIYVIEKPPAASSAKGSGAKVGTAGARTTRTR